MLFWIMGLFCLTNTHMHARAHTRTHKHTSLFLSLFDQSLPCDRGSAVVPLLRLSKDLTFRLWGCKFVKLAASKSEARCCQVQNIYRLSAAVKISHSVTAGFFRFQQPAVSLATLSIYLSMNLIDWLSWPLVLLYTETNQTNIKTHLRNTQSHVTAPLSSTNAW